jgi:hypothetical protein
MCIANARLCDEEVLIFPPAREWMLSYKVLSSVCGPTCHQLGCAGGNRSHYTENVEMQRKLFLAQRLPPVECTSVGWGHPISPKKQECGESILPKWQTNKPYVSSGEAQGLPWCTVVAGHDDLSTGGGAGTRQPRLGSYIT